MAGHAGSGTPDLLNRAGSAACRDLGPTRGDPDGPTDHVGHSPFGGDRTALRPRRRRQSCDDSPTETLDVLRESTPGAFTFSNEGLMWRERIVTLESLATVRRKFFKGFGSCAFSEPVEELVRLGIIEGEVSSAPVSTPGSRD